MLLILVVSSCSSGTSSQLKSTREKETNKEDALEELFDNAVSLKSSSLVFGEYLPYLFDSKGDTQLTETVETVPSSFSSPRLSGGHISLTADSSLKAAFGPSCLNKDSSYILPSIDIDIKNKTVKYLNDVSRRMYAVNGDYWIDIINTCNEEESISQVRIYDSKTQELLQTFPIPKRATLFWVKSGLLIFTNKSSQSVFDDIINIEIDKITITKGSVSTQEKLSFSSRVFKNPSDSVFDAIEIDGSIYFLLDRVAHSTGDKIKHGSRAIESVELKTGKVRWSLANDSNMYFGEASFGENIDSVYGSIYPDLNEGDLILPQGFAYVAKSRGFAKGKSNILFASNRS